MRGRSFLVGCLGLALVACSSGGGGHDDGGTDPDGDGDGDGGGYASQSNDFCHTIPPVNSNCSPCVGDVSDPAKAFDSKFSTYSGMASGAQSVYQGSSSQVQVAGSLAGVYFVYPEQPGLTVTISTFLDGVQQESGSPESWSSTPGTQTSCTGFNNHCEYRDGEAFVALETTLPYDEIHASVSNTGVGDILIHELCVR